MYSMTLPKVYTEQQQLQIIKRSLPPEKLSIPSLSKETGIPSTTLYAWKKKFKASLEIAKHPLPKGDWSPEDKLWMVLESYALDEVALANYCLDKGVSADQIKTWRHNCLLATDSNALDSSILINQLKQQTTQIKELKKELTRKEKDLAEITALLVLKKKAEAIWGLAKESL